MLHIMTYMCISLRRIAIITLAIFFVRTVTTTYASTWTNSKLHREDFIGMGKFEVTTQVQGHRQGHPVSHQGQIILEVIQGHFKVKFKNC